MSTLARTRKTNIGALGWVGIGLGTIVLGTLTVGGIVLYRMMRM